MRINIYSQELTNEVNLLKKSSNTGLEYHAVQFILHSSEKLHHPPQDDDRSALTFWLPKSKRNREMLRWAFLDAAEIVRCAPVINPIVIGTTGFPDFDDVVDSSDPD